MASPSQVTRGPGKPSFPDRLPPAPSRQFQSFYLDARGTKALACGQVALGLSTGRVQPGVIPVPSPPAAAGQEQFTGS